MTLNSVYTKIRTPSLAMNKPLPYMISQLVSSSLNNNDLNTLQFVTWE